MKRFIYYILISSVFICFNQLNAQQIPAFKHYVFVPEMYNPARLGNSTLIGNYRNQWADLGEDSPTSFLFNLDFSDILNLKERRIGLGVNFLSDKAHIIKRNNVSLSFAYHILDASNHLLSAGVQGGFLSQNIEFGESLLNNTADLAIFEGSQSKSVFNGGLGFSYRYFSDSGVINLDVSLPQLFTSDISYEEGTIMDIQPFALLRASYKYSSPAFGIEPIAMYRETLAGNKLKEAKIDLGARAYFLEELFWLGASFRLGGEATSINFGVKPKLLGLELLGTMEFNSVFGNSWEFGIIYNMNNKSKNLKSSVDCGKDIIVSRNIALNHLKNVEIQQKNIDNKLNQIESILVKTRKNNLSTIRLQERSEFMISKLNESKEKQGAIQTQLTQVNSIKQEIETIDNGLDRTSLRECSDYNKIVATQTQISDIYNSIDSKMSKLEAQINELSGVQSNNFFIGSFIIAKDVSKTQESLQKNLDALINKPADMLTVQVRPNLTDGMSIQYSYPNSLESYDIERDENLKDVRILSDFLVNEIRAMRLSGAKIESLKIIANMKNAPSQWHIKSGRFTDSPIQLSYPIVDRSTDVKEIKREVTIRPGDINLEELAVLKSICIKDYLGKKINDAMLPINIEIVGPNTNQTVSQIYSIEINVK